MGSGDWYHARGGQHVGPVSQQELSRRLGTGEVGADDLVWREGMPDWQPARAVPDLAGLVRPDVAPGALPVGPSGALAAQAAPFPVQPAWPQSAGPSRDGPDAPMLGYGGYTPPKPGAGGLAIAAFVMSLVALLVGIILALPALVMGIIAVYNAKRTGRPKGLAIAAVVISGIDVLLGGGFLVYVLMRH